MPAGFVALGLVQGALAALNALGLVLLWRTTRVVNLAQPAMGLVGGVLTGMLVSAAGWSFWWSAPVGVLTGALLGFLAERLVMARLAGLPRAVPMVATIGLAQLFTALQTGIPFALGGRLPSYDVDLGVELFVFPVLLKGPHLLALAVTPLVLAALWRLVHRTRIGTAAVAVGQDSERARTLGVDVGFVRAVTWTVAGALSGVAGVLSIPVLGFSLGDGVAPTVLLLALAPAVLAGLRSLPGVVATSLAVGVAYQAALVFAPTAGGADLLLAGGVLAGLGLQRRQLARDAASRRTSSWAASTTPRPLPSTVRRHPRWRATVVAATAVLLVAVALPPLWLGPAAQVRYGTGAALTLAAVAAAAAWTFAGEIALGHWGLAALDAAAALALPGPMVVRVPVAVTLTVLAGAGLAAVGHRRGGLATAVAGLAVAVGAPVALLALGPVPPGRVRLLPAAVPAVIAAAAALGLTWLRNRRPGARLVAARDEPRRAREFGIGPAWARTLGVGLSAGLAGLAGVLYVSSVPAGLAPGAFAPARSLDVLALAVVGGLGAPLGAGAGAAVLLVAGAVLPPPWGTVATGAGVLWVVLFVPGGLARALTAVRDVVARAVIPALRGDRPRPGLGNLTPGGDATPDERTAAPPGADTRQALASATVRAAVVAAGLLAGPALTGLFGAPAALRDHLGVDLGAAPWLVVALAVAAAGAAAVAWRRPVAPFGPAVGVEVAAAGAVAVAVTVLVLTRDLVLITLLLPAAPVAAGWLIARLARISRWAVAPDARTAAPGLVSAATVAGIVPAGHLALVAAGNDLVAATTWALLYLAGGATATAVAFGRLAADHHRTLGRTRSGPRTTRRTWAPLRLEDVVVDFGTARVLRGVGLAVAPGEVVALVGGNGSGKSTLLRVAAGLVAPTTGRVDVAGAEVTGLRPDERAAAGLALVSGARPVFPDLTVRENLRVGAYLTHRPRVSFAVATRHVLDLVPALDGRMDTRAGLLSGGQQRLLALAQTLYQRPTVLLADELTLGLDVDARASTLALLRTLADDGVAVVVVDHDLAGLVPMCDRVVVLHDGRTTELADPTRLEQVRGDLLPATFLTGASS